jgi:dTDP-4-amino-4,6-dideoxygalactose transaminase
VNIVLLKNIVKKIKKRLSEIRDCIGSCVSYVNNGFQLFSKQTASNKWPYYEDDEIDAVVAVLKTGRVNYWTGDTCKAFESEFAEKFGAKHAIALANGTVALELALRALGISPGDEVIVPSRTFVATASAVVAVGGCPVFADIDALTQNTTAAFISKKITPKTRCIIVVHVGGNPCVMDPICALAKQHNIRVIEDCAQAHGALQSGRYVGTIGDVGAFSFCQDKIMSTGGEGGMLLTNNDALWEAAWSYKDHGKSRKAMAKPSNGCFRFIHEYAGTNFRMTGLQAAIGRVQLTKLDKWLAARRARAERIIESVSSIPNLQVAQVPVGSRHAYYRLYATLSLRTAKQNDVRDSIVNELCERGFTFVGSGSCGEIYKELAMSEYFPEKQCVNARQASQNSIAFNIHHNLATQEIDAMLSALTLLCQDKRYWYENYSGIDVKSFKAA